MVEILCVFLFKPFFVGKSHIYLKITLEKY
jgi:hypothetical protein